MNPAELGSRAFLSRVSEDGYFFIKNNLGSKRQVIKIGGKNASYKNRGKKCSCTEGRQQALAGDWCGRTIQANHAESQHLSSAH